jgi:hypothetical protein
MNEHQQAVDLAKGEQARTLMASPLFVEAFDTLEASLVDTLLSLPIEADDQRLRVICMHKASQQIRSILGGFVSGADIVRADILEEDRRKTMLDRIKERIRHG